MAKRTHSFKRRVLLKLILPLSFKMGSSKPVNPKKVVFADNRHEELPDNMRGLEKLFLENGYDVHYYLKRKYHGGRIRRLFQRMKVHRAFARDYATAGFVMLTDYFLPVYANMPREGTRVVQLWHACGAFKKWGYSTLDRTWGLKAEQVAKFPVHNTYTDAFCSSPEIVQWYAQAYNCSPDIVHPLGTPRTDVYFDEEFVNTSRSVLEEQCPEINGRKILLYAPTFRGNSLKSAKNRLAMDIAELYERFSGDYVLVLKLHPFVAKKFKVSAKIKEECPDFVYNVSTLVDIDRAMCAADILITDYSSVVFEYSLLDRPMIFFAYDKDKYVEQRDFYYEYETFVPGEIATDTEELIHAIVHAHDAGNEQKVKEFREKFMSACDGHCTKRIYEYLTGETI